MIKFLETSKEITLSEISGIEDQLNVKFPKDFKDHYMVNNGGYPERRFYRWRDGSVTRINFFLSLHYEGFDNIEEVYTQLSLTEKCLPVGIVPFATDDGGNFFCISARREDYDKVYHFNNDHVDITKPEAALTLLEDTFLTFIANLSGQYNL